MFDIQNDPLSDFNLDFKTIVERNGLLFNEYEVATADGYLLTMYRIRAPRTPEKGGAPVVLL